MPASAEGGNPSMPLPSSLSLTYVRTPKGYGTPTPSPSNASAIAQPSPETDACVMTHPRSLRVQSRSASDDGCPDAAVGLVASSPR